MHKGIYIIGVLFLLLTSTPADAANCCLVIAFIVQID